MIKRPPTPKGSQIKIEHIYTQESEGASQDSIEFTGGFQFQPLSPRGRPTSKLSIDVPTKETSKADASHKITSQLSFSRDFGKADNVPQSERKVVPLLASIVDVRTTINSIQDEEGSSLFHSFSKIHQKSMNNLSSKETQLTLNKSETLPTIIQTQMNGGFQIRTTLVKNSGEFKKEKHKRGDQRNKTMSYLAPSGNQVQGDIISKLAASRVINDNRITLRDYMFMANTSSRKAAEMKRVEIQQARKSDHNNDSKRVLKTQPALQNTPKPNIEPVALRDRYHKEKYHISNVEMGDVLKVSIRDEIAQLSAKTDNINRWMQVHSKVSNQELILLYNMRNDLITYNKKFQESVRKLMATDNQLFSNAIRQASLKQLDANLNENDAKPKEEEDSQILELAEI